MPQITLEHTINISQHINFDELFSNVHHMLQRVADVNIESCKSRAIAQAHYFIGEGGSQKAFVYLQIALLSGRDLNVRKEIGTQALALLKKYYENIETNLDIKISVRIEEMDREMYFKA